MNTKTLQTVQEIVEKMKRNSAAWRMASPVERMELEQKNQRYGEDLRALGVPVQYDPATGVWSVKLYEMF